MTSPLPLVTDLVQVSAAIETSGTKVTRRVEIYESDSVTLWQGIDQSSRLISGSISVDYSRDERRMMDLVLENTDQLLDPDPSDGLWYDKVIKVYRGIETQEWRYETQVGEFQIDRIDQDHFPGFVKITGRDYVKKMMKSKLESATTFIAGTSIEQIIRSLAANSGVTRVNLDTSGQTLRADASFEAKTERWRVCKDICTPYNLELFVDRFGVLNARPFRDPVTSPTTYTLQTGLNGNLVTYTKSVNDSRIYNHIVVTGDNQDQLSHGILIFAEAKNQEPTSPTRISRLGTRTFPYASSQFTDNAQAQAFAEAWLQIAALEEYNLDFSSLVYPWWEVGDIVKFIDPKKSVGDPDRLLLTNLNIPLQLGPSSGTSKRVSIVGSGSVPGSLDNQEAA